MGRSDNLDGLTQRTEDGLGVLTSHVLVQTTVTNCSVI